MWQETQSSSCSNIFSIKYLYLFIQLNFHTVFVSYQLCKANNNVSHWLPRCYFVLPEEKTKCDTTEAKEMTHIWWKKTFISILRILTDEVSGGFSDFPAMSTLGRNCVAFLLLWLVGENKTHWILVNISEHGCTWPVFIDGCQIFLCVLQDSDTVQL